MNNENLFELAARHKYRFPSAVGELTLEQLYDLPLTRASNHDLDTIARTLNNALKGLGEESFVKPAPTAIETGIRNRLEIVKSVIAYKQELIATAEKAAATRARREKIREALAAREMADLSNASREDLLKELEALGDA